MLELETLIHSFKDTPLERWGDHLEIDIDQTLKKIHHGHSEHWQSVLDALPEIPADRIDMDSGVIHISTEQLITSSFREALKSSLEAFIPWRKGPFNIHGIMIETEWRSDWKWDRVKKAIAPLNNKRVLDVGCGSGYHGWRMAQSGARQVIGIDPGHLFLYQYLVVKHFMKPHRLPFYMLPLGIEDLPDNLQGFDTVFSMGILYHRKSPFEHLQKLKSCLKVDGELVLETIIIDGDEGMTLVPKDRYAKMRNVWFIPSVLTLINWLERVGFKDIKVVDLSITSVQEQRSTDWMKFESLKDFLDPDDDSLTIEGYPAPQRAVLLAKA